MTLARSGISQPHTITTMSTPLPRIRWTSAEYCRETNSVQQPHTRNDNGQGIMNSIVYQIGTTADAGNGININQLPSNLPSEQQKAWQKLYVEALGITSLPQVLFTRSVPNLSLNPLGTNMFDQVT